MSHIANESGALRRRGSQGGFTLIELLIVIVILAILAAIVVFAVGSTTKNAVAASCNADAKSVETAISSYDAQMGTFPSSLGLITTATVDANGNSVGPWLRALPSTSHYQIFIDSTGGVYVTAPTATATPTTANNYDTNANLCGAFS